MVALYLNCGRGGRWVGWWIGLPEGLCTYIRTYVHICVHLFTQVNTNTYMRTYIRTHIAHRHRELRLVTKDKQVDNINGSSKYTRRCVSQDGMNYPYELTEGRLTRINV